MELKKGILMGIQYRCWSGDTIAAVGATLTAIIALFTTVWQGCEARHHNRLSVKLILTFTSGPWSTKQTGEKVVYQIQIANAGVGPALLTKFQVFWKDESFSADCYNAKGNQRRPLNLPRIAQRYSPSSG
jgi:hypothetical protein